MKNNLVKFEERKQKIEKNNNELSEKTFRRKTQLMKESFKGERKTYGLPLPCTQTAKKRYSGKRSQVTVGGFKRLV